MKLVLDFVFNHCGKRCQLVKESGKHKLCESVCVSVRATVLVWQDALADASSPKRKYFFMGDEYKPHGYKARM